MKNAVILLTFSIAFTAISCAQLGAIRYRKYPSNPYTDIKKVAILPLINETTTPVRLDQFESIIASEMVKFNGFEVLRPMAIRMALAGMPDISNEKNVKWLGKTLGVDAVLHVKITDYDPYYPPRLSVLVNFLKTTTPTRTSVQEIDKLTRTPSWYMSKLDKDVAPYILSQFEMTFDTHHDNVRKQVTGYDYAHDERDYAFNEPGDATLLVQKNLWNYVSTEILRTIVTSKSPYAEKLEDSEDSEQRKRRRKADQ